MNRKLLVIIFFLFSISLTLACEDLTVSTFDSTYSNKEIVLCENTYSTPIIIKDTARFNLDCNGSTINSITATDSAKLIIKNCKLTTLSLTNVQQSEIRGNIITEGGISAKNLTFSMINSNTFQNNPIAIKLENSDSNSISQKNIFSSNGISIKIISSLKNTISKNIFEDGIINSDSANTWDLSGEGNYWPNYVGLDADQDGIGDTPRIIDELNKDNYPFISKSLEKIKAGKIVGEITEREGSFTLKVGDAVKFSCGENISYTLLLSEITPELTFYINDNLLAAAGFAANQVDVDSDGEIDLNLLVKSYSIESANIRVIRLDSCIAFCGDGICSAKEHEGNCPSDCRGDFIDDDVDGYSVQGGDCDDSDKLIYPGAEEKCSPSTDYDCDGWVGEADTDCQGIGLNFWIMLGVLFLIIISIILLLLWKKSSPEEYFEEEPVVEIPKTAAKERTVSPKIRRIMDYAENYVAKGYSSAQVKEVLLASGWSSSDIDQALDQLTSSGVKSEGTKESLDRLRAVIERDLAKGMSKAKIIKALKDKGWEDRVIKVILKDVN